MPVSCIERATALGVIQNDRGERNNRQMNGGFKMFDMDGILVGLVVAAAVVATVRKLVRDAKGESSCGCRCTSADGTRSCGIGGDCRPD